MTRFGTKRIGVLALAVASVTALAACSSSTSSTTSGTTTPTAPPGETTQPGSIGAIPAAGTPSGTAGSITYALPPGAVPNWILPMPDAAANSVYNVYNFEWQMWPPLYYAPDGSTPTVDASLSPANAPTWSNGDKTMTITLKPWKWSNGQTITSKDLLFTFDIISAGVKASPANWAPYVPGFFPSTITSMSTPNANTIVVNMNKAVNPTWMEEDILGSVPIMPSSEWAKDSASGATLDYTQPANALNTASGSGAVVVADAVNGVDVGLGAGSRSVSVMSTPWCPLARTARYMRLTASGPTRPARAPGGGPRRGLAPRRSPRGPGSAASR